MTIENLERVLAVGAHPDDIDFGAAGTIARWTSEGVHVAYCIVTDGDQGGFDHKIPRHEMPTIRRDEQRAAGRCVGVDEIHFLGYEDGRLSPTHELRRDISRIIRLTKPQRVICQSPERNWGRIQASHPDHLAAGEATVAAVYPDSRNPFAWPELLADGLEAHTVDEVWLNAHHTPDTWIDVTATVDAKIDAILSHVSQLPNPEAIESMVRDWLERNAELAGMRRGQLAEAFKAVRTA